jgi:hypothetical protein
MALTQRQLEHLLSQERLSSYLAHFKGDFDAAVLLYRWNATLTAAFWEPIGHLEIALRNALSAELAARHHRFGREATWLDDPARELTRRARNVIAAARIRVRQKGKPASEGQTISELSFGFWRFLVTRRLTRLWPDLAAAFPHAPNRRRETVEAPLARLHDFRNRLAHHQRIWNCDPVARYEDLLLVAGHLNPAFPDWICETSLVAQLLYEGRAHGVHFADDRVKFGLVWPSETTSAAKILERANARRMSPDELAASFGDLPTDCEK